MNETRTPSGLYYVSAYRYDADHALLGAIDDYEYPMSESAAWDVVRELHALDAITYDAATIEATAHYYPCECGDFATVVTGDGFSATCEECADPTPAPTLTLPTVGTRVRALWAVGTLTQGSGWVPARFIPEDAPTYEVVEANPLRPGSYYVQFPGGARAWIRDGQFVIA